MPITLKVGSWPVLQPLRPDLNETPIRHRLGQPVRLLPPRGQPVTRPIPLGTLVLPRYQPGAPTHVQRLTPEAALQGLIEDVAGYLDAFRQFNRERNAIFRQELGRIAARLNHLGLEPLLLKGANALLPGAYPGAEDRMLGDLDLWLPAARHPEAMAVLLELGYEPAHESRQWWMASEHAGIHHGVPLLHHTLPTKVELHMRLLLDPADDAHLVTRLKTVTHTLPGGARVLTPDRLSQIRHNCLHAQISDHQARERRLNLRHLLELARLAESLDTGDTEQLLSGLRPQRHRAFLEYWALAEHWLGLPYPESLPRSPRQNRELWLTERAAESRAWAKSFRAYGQLLRLPPRLLGFGKRVWQKPGYVPFAAKAWLDSRNPRRSGR